MKLKSATDLSIVAVLAALSIWSVRPLLEEWGFMAAFRQQGLGYLWSIQGLIALRPLHIVPPVAQWLVGFGHPIGYGFFAAILISVRYAVCYWAVSFLPSRHDRTLFATLAAVFVGWQGQWLSRFNPAQLSAILFFAILGLCLRMVDRRSALHVFFIVTSVVALLMTYQALALCCLAVPVLVILVRVDADVKGRNAGAAWSAASIVGGFLLYFAYTTTVSLFFDSSYEQGVVSTLLSGGFLVQMGSFICAAYKTAYLNNDLILVTFLAISGFCFAGAFSQPSTRLRIFLLWWAGVALLPMASVVYLYSLHLNDPERVLFPTSVAFCTLVLVGLARSSSHISLAPWKYTVILSAICAAGLSAVEVRREWNFQANVLSQLQTISLSTGASDAVLVDETGRLGDVYTFLPGTLSSAMSALGTPMNVEICTPLGVDRLHDIARRYPIATTPRCEEIEFGSRYTVFASSVGSDAPVISQR